jgi:hypothetical protein
MSMPRSALVLTTICLAAGGASGCAGASAGASPGATGSGGEGGGAATSSAGAGGADLGTVVGDCFDYTGWSGMTPAATFKADVLPILRASCSDTMSCHGSQNNPDPTQHFYGTPESQGAMTAAQIQAIFAGAVNQASIDEPDMDVIKAGDPAHSFMTYKLDATSAVDCSALTCNAAMACGSPMPMSATPMSATPLSLASRDVIRRWIAQGARND